MMSLWAAEHLCEDIVRLNGNEPVANLYTLVTNHAPWGGTEFLEYIDEDDKGAAARKYIIEGYKHQSRVYYACKAAGGSNVANVHDEGARDGN